MVLFRLLSLQKLLFFQANSASANIVNIDAYFTKDEPLWCWIIFNIVIIDAFFTKDKVDHFLTTF